MTWHSWNSKQGRAAACAPSIGAEGKLQGPVAAIDYAIFSNPTRIRTYHRAPAAVYMPQQGDESYAMFTETDAA
jgi:hypothetical protein